MNSDFHYYATFCAAVLAGYSHEEAEQICYSARLVDHCTRTFLASVDGPKNAATTQLQSEMVDAKTDLIGLQDITRIWASFHFLPRDLKANIKKGSRGYKNKYRLICGPNGDLLVDTVKLAKGKGLEAVGLSMHVLADTWAHTYFAGTPSLVINNTDRYFYELIPDGNTFRRRPVVFGHNPAAAENPETGSYTGSIYQASERSIMNLGHGRAGHLPDYSYIRYEYMPAWGDYSVIVKDNQHDYLYAFTQMVYAMRYLRGDIETFEKDTYDWDAVKPYEEFIRYLLAVRRTDDSEDWKELGEFLTEKPIRDFNIDQYKEEYKNAREEEKDDTFLGRFILAALAQKSMVVSRIASTGNLLAGFSISLDKAGKRKGIKDYYKLLKQNEEEEDDDE